MMKITKSVCALLFLCACSPSWSPFGYHAQEHDRLVTSTQTYQDALLALNRRDYDAALARFQSLNRRFRESPAALYGMARAYEGKGEPAKAIFMYEIVLKADPSHAQAIEGLNQLFGNRESEALAEVSAPVSPQAPEQIIHASLSEPIASKDATRSRMRETSKSIRVPTENLPVVTAPTRARITVLNGNGQVGIADRYATTLVRQQFLVLDTASADRFDYDRTIIRYRPGLRHQAHSVAKSIGLNADLQESSKGFSDITVVLGADAF